MAYTPTPGIDVPNPPKNSSDYIVVPKGGSYTGPLSGGGSGGTYTDSNGNIISAGRGSTVGSSSKSSGYHSGFEEQGYVNRQNSVRNEQERIARRNIGQIRNVTVDQAKGVRTFIGYNGRSYAFPIDDISFSGANRFGGIASRESQIYVRENGITRQYNPSEFQKMRQKEFESTIDETFRQQLVRAYAEQVQNKINAQRIPTSQREFAKDLFIRQGYKVTEDKYGNLIVKDKNNQIVISGEDIIGYDESGRRQFLSNVKYAIAPKSAKIFAGNLPTREQQYKAYTKQQQKIKENKLGYKIGFITGKFLRGLGDTGIDGAKGIQNYVKAASKAPYQFKTAYDLILKATAIKNAARKYNDNRTNTNKRKLKESLYNYKIQETKLNRAIRLNKEGQELINKPESKLALNLIVLAALGTVGGFAVGSGIKGVSLLGKGINLGMGGVGLYATYEQAKETIKNPTPRNLGRLAFFGLPMAASALKSVRKSMDPSFRPNVKNANVVRIALKQKLEAYNKVLRNRKAVPLKVLSDIRKEIPKVKASIRELNKISKDNLVINSRDFNPRIPSKYLKRYQGAIKTLYHVSTEPKINKLLGKKIEKIISTSQFNKLVKEAPINQKNILRDIKTKKIYEKEFLKEITKRKGIVYGGKAIQLQTSELLRILKGRKKSIDFDIFLKNAKKQASNIKDILNKKFETKEFTTKKAVNPYTTKLYYKKIHIADITEVKQAIKEFGKLKLAKTKSGLKILSQRQLLQGKMLAALERTGAKRIQDLKDISIISKNKITAKELFPKVKNAKDIFEVVENAGGQVSKARLKFKELFLFLDLESATGYGQGKKYSILEIAKNRISKYPKTLRDLVKKASKGQLSARQTTQLRKRLVAYAKKNPGKVLPGTRTLSQSFGEREFIASASTKLKRIGKFKTFDSDLRKFIEVGVFSRSTRSQKISFVKKLVNAYKKNPFQRLKLKLTNPDIIKVRKYAKLLEKDFDLSKAKKLTFNKIFQKLFASKKALFKLTSEERASFGKIKKFFKDPRLAKTALQNQIIEMSELRRRVDRSKEPIRFSRVKSRVLKPTERRSIIELREIIRVPKSRLRLAIRNPQRELFRNIIRIRDLPRILKIPRTISRERPSSRSHSRSTVRVSERVRTPTRIVTRTPIRNIKARTRTRIVTPTIKYKSRIKPPTKLNEESSGKKDIVKLAKKKRKFIYMADLISIIYNKYASKKEARRLKQTGRFFTGFEARPMI